MSSPYIYIIGNVCFIFDMKDRNEIVSDVNLIKKIKKNWTQKIRGNPLFLIKVSGNVSVHGNTHIYIRTGCFFPFFRAHT